MLVLAPFASATSDPLSSGTTTLTLNKNFFKKLKKSGVKVLKVSPAAVKSRTVTLPVSGGSLDPITGLGTIEQSGGIKFKAGKKTAPVNTLVLETSTGALNAKVAGKTMKFASVKGVSVVRNGFGANVSVASFKLTGKAAKQLNKKLGFTGKKKSKGKSKKRASASKTKAVQPPFKGNQVLGASTSETQPKTVAVLPTGNVSLTLNPAALLKLKRVGPPPGETEGPFAVKLSTVSPSSILSAGPPPTLGFPISGGSIGPSATTGILQTIGGLRLTQNLEALGGNGETTLTMGNIWVDLGAKTASVEVSITNTKNQELNKGNLGRASIADISLVGATITSNPSSRTVTVQNASATLQAVTAETLNSVFIAPIEKGIPAEPEEKFAAGDPLGTFSFTALTQ